MEDLPTDNNKAMKINTLHIFNPEHDIALAANIANFTAPHAGRLLRNDLGFLPVLWAAEGDAVLVESAEGAERASRRLRSRLGRTGCLFVEKDQLSKLDISNIAPWGWDLSLRALLLRKGVSEEVLPSTMLLEFVRELSHRRTSARLLPLLQQEGTIGEAYECTTAEQVAELMERYGHIVLKAPWSSSGRGVRFDENAAWVQNIIERQGSIMVEPYYNKVKDFAMEFTSTAEGICYEGLSLFHTKNGAYVGNVLATEQAKREDISRYVSLDLLDEVRDRIISHAPLAGYEGPFGIDMMLVKHPSASEGKEMPLLLHPCVEINLRRTMGHVALALSLLTNPAQDDDIRKVMRVIYSGNNYQLTIRR